MALDRSPKKVSYDQHESNDINEIGNADYRFSIFISCGRFDGRMGAILAISVVGHARNVSAKLVLKSDHLFGRRCHLKVFFSIFSSGGHFAQGNRTIFAILVKGHPRKSFMKLF